ncbi:hypothetical protein [Tropicimonas marinistellae]|uniref:hypothetical protein n=1 Tax=Tropicimonas marinistellae TaxID=1739787 RepID=UPI0008373155|nr:hypothetical protein [Tropicimonas marinistellae]
MNVNYLIAAMVAGASVFATGNALADDLPSPSDNDRMTINVSCYRGALKTVAWDRPNAVFIDDLLQLGYTPEQADAIGNRVCRDEYGVGNGAHKIETLKKLLKEIPPG